jgi:hypothetical protein
MQTRAAQWCARKMWHARTGEAQAVHGRHCTVALPLTWNASTLDTSMSRYRSCLRVPFLSITLKM